MKEELRFLAEHASDEMGHPSKPFSLPLLLREAYEVDGTGNLRRGLRRLVKGLLRLGWLIPLGRGVYLPSPELVDVLVYVKDGPSAFTPEGAEHVRGLIGWLRRSLLEGARR